MRYLFLISFLFISHVSLAQSSIPALQDKMFDLNRSGMMVLGSWAVGNLAVSGARYFQTTGETQRFHQMNVFWNVVNLGLAGGGLYQTLHPDYASDSYELLSEVHNTQMIFLVNTALDVAYVTGGFYLIERSKNSTKNNSLFSGYGKSLILQGAFLLVFDGIMFGAHKKLENSSIRPNLSLSEGLTPTPQVGLTLTF